MFLFLLLLFLRLVDFCMVMFIYEKVLLVKKLFLLVPPKMPGLILQKLMNKELKKKLHKESNFVRLLQQKRPPSKLFIYIFCSFFMFMFMFPMISLFLPIIKIISLVVETFLSYYTLETNL